MVIKVGINGFGRVGRVIFRTCLGHPNIEIVAINDPAIEVEYICYLIKFDSTHGTLRNNVTHTENEIKVDELCIKVFQHKQPCSIPWHSAGVHYVVEASGMFTSLEKAQGHLHSEGVKRVLVTAPSVDVPMVILGVNDGKIKPEYKVISCGSSTLYCLAPIVKVLEDNYGLDEAFATSIHAMTPSLKPLDGLCIRGKHWRDHRSITQNIIPAVTGACRALGRVLPAARDRVCGLAFRVPIANVSVLDLTVRLKKYTSIENIVSDVQKFSKATRETIITTSSEESVSSDFIGDTHSCILDVNSSLQLKPNSFKLICWYENEYSYSCRVVDLILFSELQLENYNNKTTYVRPRSSAKQDIDQQTDCVLFDTMQNCGDKKSVTFKSPPKIPRPLVLKKPVLQSHIPCPNRDQKKLELINIWKETNNEIINSQKKSSSTLHGYRDYASKELVASAQIINTVDCFKAQERLEKVKKEFSKMVSITEDLLKKSYNSRLCLSSLDTSKEELSKSSNSNASRPALDKVAEIQDVKKNTANVYADKSSASTSGTRNMLASSKGEVETFTYEGNQSDYSMRISPHGPTVSSSIKEIRETKETVNTTAVNPTTKDQETILETPISNKNFLSKTFTNLFDGFSKNFQFQSNVDKKNLKVKDSTDKIMDKYNTTTEVVENKTKNSLLLIPNTSLIDENLTTLQIMNVNVYAGETNDKTKHKKNTNINESCNLLTDKHTAKTETQDERQNTMVDMEVKDADKDQRCGEDVDGLFVNVDIDEGSSREERIALKLEGSYTSLPECEAAPDLPALCSPSYRNKQDIFDKLDSASNSDSENSFEVDSRKSQIIKITDLTNSLEDLDRLDKICRIMEISDELSNKLFSTLDGHSDSLSATDKKWSFKDLCEKINLDEFCNKVFGK